MARPIFKFGGARPLLVCSVTDFCDTDLISTFRNAIFDGADGFLIHMERLKPEFQNRETLKRIFDFAEDKPILTLNYRTSSSKTDDELAALQYEAIEAGAGCVDVMDDMFGKRVNGLEIPEEAEKKQLDYIARIHERGAQVMISSHIWEYLPPDRIFAHAQKLKERGADIVKIANRIETEDQLLEGMKATVMMRRQLGAPFLHIMMGQYGKVHRALAPTLGSAMVLCVQRYTPVGHKDKPLLRATRALYDNLDWKPTRDIISED